VSAAHAAAIAPGATIGILGGGQLGRMTALAAARLGYRCHVFCPEADSPAMEVAAESTVADDTDSAALDRFAAAVAVATYEFENVPAAAAERLAARVTVRPGPRALAVAGDRVAEKRFLNDAGVPTTRFAPVATEADLAGAVAAVGLPAILKTTRLGYDGKGQARLKPGDDPAAAWRHIGGVPAILEATVDFACEVSVIAARGLDGTIVPYVPVENTHDHGILATTRAPARIAPAVAEQALSHARKVAAALDIVGLVAVEMFVTRDGTVLANEIAPRPHNSGHWTIDACAVSQFEQLVRAVCGLPLGDPERHSDAVMENLIGDAVERWPQLLEEPGACLHLYGKRSARPGRKMGHVTRITPRR